ncbi:DUF2059 domain-containing protein [uncultured Porticoccus sp.]|uniref:DUF2059 domain-containing protein n=1 Tax=uncultured Porticoccus sp. TaxID=1256050 RepID=UPI00260735FF|nr:DUF2059 domain-containing protein [uncultured Porticoccus sp.]
MAISFMLSGISFAASDEHKKAAEELLLLTKVNEQMTQVLEGTKQAQIRQIQQMNLPVEAAPVVEQYFIDLTELLQTAMGWDTLKNEYIRVYTEAFSISELKEISKFYKSAAGRNYISKRVELNQGLMAVAEKQTVDLQPKVILLQQKLSSDLQKLK